MSGETSTGKSITKVELTITNLWDWAVESDKLFIDLLNNPKYSGVRSLTDSVAGLHDYFPTASGSGKTWTQMTQLTDWSDPQGGHSTNFVLVYDFSPAEIAALTGYLTDSRTWFGSTRSVDFGIGFDPDCHYYDCRIKLDISTCRVPVPEAGATFVLLALGILALPGFKRLLRA